MLSVGHECLGARQTQGGHANATRADSSRQQTADSSSPEWLATALLATTDTLEINALELFRRVH
jgi:hypothetical protein